MSRFPPLFDNCHSYYVREAYDRIKTFHDTGYDLLLKADADVIQLKVAADNLRLRALPLMEDLIHTEIIPRDWLNELADCTHTVEEGLRSRTRLMQEIGSATEK